MRSLPSPPIGRERTARAGSVLLALALGCSETPGGAADAGPGAAGALGVDTAGVGGGGAATSGAGSSAAAGQGGESLTAGAAGGATAGAPAVIAGAGASNASAGEGSQEPADAGGDPAPEKPDASDVSPLDAGDDASETDAGDGGAVGCVEYQEPDDCTVPEGAVLPGELRCTGLYADGPDATRPYQTLHCGVREYAPAYALWSDGLRKRRFVALPPGTQIDVTDPLDFEYPVGTQFWKEFSLVEGDTERRAETRLLRKVDGGWLYTTYVWSEDGSAALQQNDGVPQLFGSGHNVPSRQQCKECHSGRKDYVLGWDAFLLGPGADGLTRESLTADAWVTWDGQDEGAPNPLLLTPPGDATELAALGYLHVNCGVSCHNDNTFALALETGFFTRLEASALDSVPGTAAYQTGLMRRPSPNAPLADLPAALDGLEYVDLRPLAPESSLLYVRMLYRDVDAAMPRLGTSAVDESGVAAVKAWIESMTPERGYPTEP